MPDFSNSFDCYFLMVFFDVDFPHVEVLTGGNADARTAFVARGIGSFTIESLREIARRGRLTTTWRAHEQIGMRDVFAVDGALQQSHHVVLTRYMPVAHAGRLLDQRKLPAAVRGADGRISGLGTTGAERTAFARLAPCKRTGAVDGPA